VGRSKNSVVVNTRDIKFLIDSTSDIVQQLERERIDHLDFMLFTGHPDSFNGLNQLIQWMSEKDLTPMMTFMPLGMMQKLQENAIDTSALNIKYFNNYVDFEVDQLTIKPFALKGNSQTGIKFMDVVFAEDFEQVPVKSEEYFQNTEIVLINSEFYSGADFYKNLKLNQLVLLPTKINNNDYGVVNLMQSYYGNDVKVTMAEDGLRLYMPEYICQTLTSVNEAINLPTGHANLILSGDKKLIIDSKLMKNRVSKLLYVTENDLCFGIIRLRYPDRINMEKFFELSSKHNLTADEKNKFWPNKEVLFAYNFDVIETFETPRAITMDLCGDGFCANMEFVEKEFIKDIKTYDPEKLDTNVLKDDWRIANAWYSSAMSGKKMVHSIEDIYAIARMIYLELKKRGIEFHPETMKPHSRDLYHKIAKEIPPRDLSDPKLLEEFKDKIILKDFICVTGSTIENKSVDNPHDMDILIRMNNPSNYLRQTVELRLLKDLSFAPNVHFTWGDPEGPHDSYKPLFDLCLKRSELRTVMMSSEAQLTTPPLFFPMKPKNRFYQVDEAVKYMFEHGSKYALEKKYNGFRCLIIKSGYNVKIFSEHKRDVSRHFKHILQAASELTNKDFVLDCEMVHGAGGRSEIIKFIIGKQELDDSGFEAHAFDLVFLDGCLASKPWFERKSLLHSLHFGKFIREVHSIIVDSAEQAKKGINFLKDMNGSEGAIIKKYDGLYAKNGETDDWIKFRNEDTIIVKVMDVHKKINGYSYTIGIETDPNLKFKEEYMENGLLRLGNTFVTTEKHNVGDKIAVNIEEVWRHTYPNHEYRYSIHKPKVMGPSNEPLSKSTLLDDLAVSKGEEVVENSDMGIDNKEIEIENHVVKRGDKWCVVHGHPQKPGSKTDKPPGSIIHCFPTREQAEAQHKAIIVSEIKRGEMMQVELDDDSGDFLASYRDETVIETGSLPCSDSGGPTPVSAFTPGGIIAGGPADEPSMEENGHSQNGIVGTGSDWDATNKTTTDTKGIKDVQGKTIAKKIIAAPKRFKTMATTWEGDYTEIRPSDDVDWATDIQMMSEEELASIKGEGGEPEMISDFPKRMQRDFTAHVDMWRPYVMQWHLRGEKSIHTDLRMDAGESLEGFTLFSQIADGDIHHIRGTVKLPQPKAWLHVQGGFKIGQPGTTSKHDAYFAIVSKGKYRPIEVEDHKIVLEFKADSGKVEKVNPLNEEDKSITDHYNSILPENLADLNGFYSYHVAHIGDRHIMLFDKLKRSE
jgi:hypothetical protein